MFAYDLSAFHKDCKGVTIVGENVFCPTCRVVAQITAVAKRVSYPDAFNVDSKQRKALPGSTKGLEEILK